MKHTNPLARQVEELNLHSCAEKSSVLPLLTEVVGWRRRISIGRGYSRIITSIARRIGDRHHPNGVRSHDLWGDFERLIAQKAVAYCVLY